MDYVINIGLLIIGFIFLVKGADFFVASSSSIARKFKVSPLVIGLTLVAFGTSLPELAVSFIASLTVEPGATADIAMGNVIGSSIVNISLILGLTALARPVKVSNTMYRKEFPYLLFSSILILVLALFFQSDTRIVWYEALILLITFIVYIYIMIKTGKSEDENVEFEILNMKKSVLLLVIGLAGVTLGGYMVTEGASNLATTVLVGLFGMSTTKAITLVGLSVVAVGTSLPEMVTSVVAAKKGENEIAFGNLVGSNIFNILFILGLSGLFTPLGINGDVVIDTFIMLGVTIIAVVFAITKDIVSKKEGLILVLIYATYITYIILRALTIV
ncbi:calcium/sodium antiporter [Acholeplasma laidlawii]|uniref:Sodium/calcium exchanger n=2 Tax=Acholeplasma laidlawii TaxID=2148 RepID=A9NHU5_ACHLI|nr:calcium/sodium antiporter [Acholeplasma laidlawii]ABX81925.1 sodium/calcium exchanger [Acholeplasma laidlawii PG-8A]NWH10907.1 calcium/sodium antiporter [Acholeplasma laidlawii]NWH12293.1 calcium/sodium antiporter [Acholeplasma laidlawii]NWH13679.1 calcium/sodium antiporter [Acholeplasma laidlawii]NWH14998.1 calcium/sodium antiporter [Acholeplasma laidlawii]